MVLIFSSTLDNLELGLATSQFSLIDKASYNFKQKHSEYMIPTIEKFLTKHQLKLQDINTIYFTNGPGSFTGNRLGIVFVKTIKVIKPLTIYTIDTLSTLVGSKSGTLSIDAKSHKFYTGKFKKGILQKPILITQDNQSTIDIDNNVIENMISKIKHAQKIFHLNDIKPLYVKEL